MAAKLLLMKWMQYRCFPIIFSKSVVIQCPTVKRVYSQWCSSLYVKHRQKRWCSWQLIFLLSKNQVHYNYTSFAHIWTILVRYCWICQQFSLYFHPKTWDPYFFRFFRNLLGSNLVCHYVLARHVYCQLSFDRNNIFKIAMRRER